MFDGHRILSMQKIQKHRAPLSLDPILHQANFKIAMIDLNIFIDVILHPNFLNVLLDEEVGVFDQYFGEKPYLLVEPLFSVENDCRVGNYVIFAAL